VGRRASFNRPYSSETANARDQRTNRITTTATAMTRAAIAIVRVSMLRPYSVSLAVPPDAPSRVAVDLVGAREYLIDALGARVSAAVT
jgi:hypothetical protein